MTRTGALDPRSRFFTAGDSDRLVYCSSSAVAEARRRFGAAATVADAGARPSMDRIVSDLACRGVTRLLVEGGGDVLTQFLTGGLADELHLAVAPLFVGDHRGARFVTGQRAELIDTRAVGDVALLRYALSDHCTDGPTAAVAFP